jgi:hypothetical protein
MLVELGMVGVGVVGTSGSSGGVLCTAGVVLALLRGGAFSFLGGESTEGGALTSPCADAVPLRDPVVCCQCTPDVAIGFFQTWNHLKVFLSIKNAGGK